MTGQEAITYIHSMTWDRRATGYEQAKELLERMGNPEKKLKYVHIGGTNGKGSTAAMIASILQKAGYRTGLYTSPYLFRFHERIRVNGEQITDAELADVTAYVRSFVEEMASAPSEFALVCCVAFEYFARKRCDIVVLEVGMGGENDSTNVIDCPEVAVLTNIGLDHTEYLGGTVEEIARTKAGILKENGTAVLYPVVWQAEAVIKEVCKKRNVELTVVDPARIKPGRCGLDGQTFDYGEQKGLRLSLSGTHQLKNAAVALTAVDLLKRKGWQISEEAVFQGLCSAVWPGRFEVLSKEPPVILDGGHNPQCIEALAQNIKEYLPGRRVIAVVGVLADKAYEEMFRPVFPYVSEFVCITPPSPRSLAAADLAACLQKAGQKASAYSSEKEALRQALFRAGDDGAVVCFGSLYSIAPLREALKAVYLHEIPDMVE